LFFDLPWRLGVSEVLGVTVWTGNDRAAERERERERERKRKRPKMRESERKRERK